MMREIRERKHNTPDELWRGFLGHCAYYVSWPHSLISWLHKVRGVKIQHPMRVRISANVIIDTVYPELVEIGDDVFVTRGVVIVAHFEPTPFLRQFIPMTEFGEVRIERGVYIGVNAIILPGVTLGEGSIIGSGSVVTKNIPPYSVAVGNPARVIRSVKERGKEACR
jgi:acetyltransferase-like isoleucine patch superfamily enzyme